MRGCVWSLLPPPLLGLCLSHLPLCDLLQARTCRDWRLRVAQGHLPPLPPLTLVVRPRTVDALSSNASIDRALRPIASIQDLTLTEPTADADGGEAEQRSSGYCDDWASLARPVMRGFPSSWTLNDAVPQLVELRRRRARPLRRGGESRRRSCPLLRLTLTHRADRLPLTISALSALCFLLPTLQELRLSTTETEAPAGCEAARYHDDGYCEALLRPLSQLQLRVLALPPWATLTGLRAIFDSGGHYEAECTWRCKEWNGKPKWSQLDEHFLLTPCARSLQTLTLQGAVSADGPHPLGYLEADAMPLCARLPALQSLTLSNFWVSAEAAGQVELMRGLTALHLPGCWMSTETLSERVLPHQPALTSLDLGRILLGYRAGAARLLLSAADFAVRCDHVRGPRSRAATPARADVSVHQLLLALAPAERRRADGAAAAFRLRHRARGEAAAAPHSPHLADHHPPAMARESAERSAARTADAGHEHRLPVVRPSPAPGGDAVGLSCRGVTAEAAAAEAPSSTRLVEQSRIDSSYVECFQRSQPLPSLTQLTVAAPV